MDTDVDALTEYAVRLMQSFHATQVAPHEYQLPRGGPLVRLHASPVQALPPDVGLGHDCAILSFSLSQIVGSAADARALWHDLCVQRGIPRVVAVVHDHGHAGLPHPQQDGGVSCTVVAASTRCQIHTGTATEEDVRGCAPCSEAGAAAVLRTRVAGTRMAADIQEYALCTHRLLQAPGVLPPGVRWRIARPFQNDAATVHWLLRSLAFVTLYNAFSDPAYKQ